MSLILSGTDGLSDIDGSAATPAIRGTDANTGIFFGTDIIGFAEGGAEVARFNADAQFVAAAGTASLPVITTTGDVNTGIFFPAADTIAFAEGGVESMRLDSSGNVGIGTSSPSYKLHVVKGASDNAVVIDNGGGAGDSTNPYLAFSGTSGGSNFIRGRIRAAFPDATGGGLVFDTGTSGSMSERMRIDSSGNVILNLNSVTNTNGYGGLNLYAPSNVQFQIYMLKQSQIECHIGFKSGSDNNFYVGTGGGGNGVGTYGLYQQNLTNSWSAVSDLRFKTELEPITNALEKVSNVRTVTGRFIHDEENGATRRLPFLIAQDFVDALPEAVDQKDPDKLGLSYSDTVVLAFAAIKELKALTDTQAATIEALTARITALETQNADNPPQGETP